MSLPKQKIEHPLAVVRTQASSEGIWFKAETAPEAMLQSELRRLHASVEKWSTEDQKRIKSLEDTLGNIILQARRGAVLDKALTSASFILENKADARVWNGVWHVCPGCPKSFLTDRAYRAHWKEAHSSLPIPGKEGK